MTIINNYGINFFYPENDWSTLNNQTIEYKRIIKSDLGLTINKKTIVNTID